MSLKSIFSLSVVLILLGCAPIQCTASDTSIASLMSSTERSISNKINNHKNRRSLVFNHRILPVDSFVMIQGKVNLIPKKCKIINLITKKEAPCEKNELAEDRARISKMKPAFRGSGIVIKVDKDETYILTARHVCTKSDEITVARPIAGAPNEVMMEWEVEQTVVSRVMTQDGVSRKSSVVKFHKEKDICIMKSPGGWGTPAPIAKQSPQTGEVVYNIAAPLGMFEPGKTTLIFSGHTSGIDTDGDAWFTIPAKPGSSGSAVINNRGEVVAVIYAANTHLESFSLAVPLKYIKQLLKESLTNPSAAGN